MIGAILVLLACIALVVVTHGWALVVPGFVLLCWGAWRLTRWSDRRQKAREAELATIHPIRRSP